MIHYIIYDGENVAYGTSDSLPAGALEISDTFMKAIQSEIDFGDRFSLALEHAINNQQYSSSPNSEGIGTNLI